MTHSGGVAESDVSTLCIMSMRFRAPSGAIVRTGYVPVHQVRLACRDRMAVGDGEAAYRRRLQLGNAQPWPPPVGHWEGEAFVIVDGRHEYVAALMLGFEELLVAWVELDPVSRGGSFRGDAQCAPRASDTRAQDDPRIIGCCGDPC